MNCSAWTELRKLGNTVSDQLIEQMFSFPNVAVEKIILALFQ